jgi:hypothetical protein
LKYRPEVVISSNFGATFLLAQREFNLSLLRFVHQIANSVDKCSPLALGFASCSRAFTRYRTIDIDMKKNLVKILEGKQ